MDFSPTEFRPEAGSEKALALRQKLPQFKIDNPVHGMTTYGKAPTTMQYGWGVFNAYYPEENVDVKQFQRELRGHLRQEYPIWRTVEQELWDIHKQRNS